MGRVPLLHVFRSLQFTPDQLQRFRSALEAAEAELKGALAAQTMEISSTGDLQLWFRQALKREADFDRLLTARQKKSLALAERIRRARPMMWFSLDEIEPELIDGIVKILNRFDAQIADIPKTQWGRNMVYQEAKLDRDSGILRLVMSSKQLSPRRKGQIAKPSLDACFTFLSRFFPPNLERVLNTWPASLPVELPGDPSTVESLTPKHWFRIYEILAQESIWDAVKDAQLTVYATLFAAQATDGKAMEMQMLREYKINRASYRLAEALFADPAFTPLQKLLLYEAFWNRVGPYIGYFYALDLDADVFYERLLEMRRLLAFISSAAPYTQGIFSISDIAERQKTSLKSAKRWTEIGGHFSEEEMEVLQARYDELMARLEEWGRYQPPDPNKPAEPAPPPPPEQLE